MQRFTRAFRIVLLVVLAGGSSGCLAVAVGAAAAGATAGTVLYVKGALEVTVTAAPEKVVDASKAALDEMNIAVLSSRASGVDGEVIGRTATDKKVTIVVTRQHADFSKLSIRIGVFGDRDTSMAIYERIKPRL